MKKSTQIFLLTFTSIFAIGLISAIFLVSPEIDNQLIRESREASKIQISQNKINDPKNIVDNKKLNEEYESSVKNIISEFEAMDKSGQLSAPKVDETKEKLLQLKLTKSYKDLHLNLIFALDKMKKYFESGNEKEKIASIEMISNIKTKYPWIN